MTEAGKILKTIEYITTSQFYKCHDNTHYHYHKPGKDRIVRCGENLKPRVGNRF